MVKVLILCGGFGKRLRPLTDNVPKPMLKVAGKPMLQHQVEMFKAAGFDQFVFCTGYKHEVIEDYFGDGSKFGIQITYSKENEPLGTSGAIKLGAAKLNELIVVSNGDILHDANPAKIVQFHKEIKASHPALLATIMLVRMRSPYGIVKLSNGLISEFCEKPLLNEWINAGIYILEPQLIKQIPDKGAIEVEIFPQLAKHGQIAGYKHEGKWRDVGTIKDFEEAQKEFSNL